MRRRARASSRRQPRCHLRPIGTGGWKVQPTGGVNVGQTDTRPFPRRTVRVVGRPDGVIVSLLVRRLSYTCCEWKGGKIDRQGFAHRKEWAHANPAREEYSEHIAPRTTHLNATRSDTRNASSTLDAPAYYSIQHTMFNLFHFTLFQHNLPASELTRAHASSQPESSRELRRAQRELTRAHARSREVKASSLEGWAVVHCDGLGSGLDGVGRRRGLLRRDLVR